MLWCRSCAALLMLSDVSPKEELQQHQIECLADSPHMDSDLSDHCAISLHYKVCFHEDISSVRLADLIEPQRTRKGTMQEAHHCSPILHIFKPC